MPLSLVVRGGTVYDGTGSPGVRSDVLIDGDRIVGVRPAPEGFAGEVIDAQGRAVAPGFINVLSHAWGSLQRDPTGASDVLQGVTTEVFGEGFSLGPGSSSVADYAADSELAKDALVDFPRLSDGLSYLERLGIAPNVASFVGGHNLRMLGAGLADGPMDPAALDRVCGVLDEEMADGALGLGTALIYPPGEYADTAELVAQARVVGRHDGLYISHLRSEAGRFLAALEELMQIGAAASVRAEVYHLKAAGQANWPLMRAAIDRIDRARGAGRAVTADMYPYTAGYTTLGACIPPAYHVGGPAALSARLADPATRAGIAAELRSPSADRESLYRGSGGTGILFFADLPDGIPARGRHLSEVAQDLGLDEVDALLRIVADRPSTEVAYFDMAEANVQLGLAQPWVAICSDARAHQAVAPWTDAATHPRTYGAFARVLGHYCRDQGLFPLAEAIRRMTSLPADTLRLAGRGRLGAGCYADLAVFDPDTIKDTATFADPHQYANGVSDVLVNGVPVVRHGALTQCTPGRRLRRTP